MNIGEQINNLRKQHGLSQDDFANLFNVSRQTISNWENGGCNLILLVGFLLMLTVFIHKYIKERKGYEES